MEEIEDDLPEIAKFENELISKNEYLTRVGLWPSKRNIDYISWLRNFTEAEKEHALKLLSKFQYINDDYCNELFKESIIKATQLSINYSNNESIKNQWKQFLESCIISPVRGENTSLADSGYSYVQKARDLFGLNENQFFEPEIALRKRFTCWVNGVKPPPIIFVDDFIGSGNQFLTMWNKMHDILNLEWHSHESMTYKDKANNIYYCCLLGLDAGIRTLEGNCRNINICVGHVIEDKESIFNMESKIWNGNAQVKGVLALKEASLRYKMPDTNGKDTKDWKGYCEQGLLLAIKNGAPDASIGAIRWNENGWQPLIKKA